LNTGFASSANERNVHQKDQNQSLIEYLAQHSEKPKNYRREPNEPVFNGYFLNGSKNNDSVNFEYKFPLLNKKESTIRLIFNPVNFSNTIDKFGVHNSCFASRDENTYVITSDNLNYLLDNMNRDGFFFKIENGSYNFGVDYNQLVDISAELGTQIAGFILKELQSQNADSYINRVRATLNFVQYIPYGQPNFDAEDYGYFGISLPHESIAISYSDCDSKSILFACILKALIKIENIILVNCTTSGGGHMIVGVSNLPFSGQMVDFNGKRYILLETTTPTSLEEHFLRTDYKDLKIIELV